MCIICFLTDNFQSKLRYSSQVQCDRYEHSLLNYKKNFISEFKERLILPLCSNHIENTDIVEILKQVPLKSIDDTFDSLRDVYLSWIDSKPTLALTKLYDFITKNNLSKCTESIDHMIFFRGRTSDTILSHWDMFHIPFNKRYMIGNQRYSLVGQPLLYLALTPLGVLLETNSNEESNLRISTFYFKNNSNKKIFDLRNSFYKLIKDKSNTASLINGIITTSDDAVNKSERIVLEFYKLILSSCCSFKRKKELNNSFFCEEYVLPQILAQILKQENFDGILFSSTKVNNTNNSFVTFYRDNLALFTRYDLSKSDDETYVYDKDLYNLFKISAPISIQNNIDMNLYDINVEQMFNLVFSKDFDSDTHLQKFIAYNIINYMDLKDLYLEDVQFSQTISGKFYQVMLANIFSQIKNDFLYNISLKEANNE